MDRHKLSAWRAFLEAHAALVDVLERELRAATGLSLTQYDVLVQLDEAGGALAMQVLARRVLLSKSGLTRLCDRLEVDGLVVREPSERDRRVVLARLTRAGVRALRRAAPVHLDGIARHFAAHISAQEAATLTSALRRIRDAACGGDGDRLDDR